MTATIDTPPTRTAPVTTANGLAVLEASAALRDLCRAVSEAESALARRLGLRAADYRAVKRVLYTREPVGITELADDLGLSKGSTSELVDRLEARDLVRRGRSADDGRRVVLEATPLAVDQVHETLGDLFTALADVARSRDAITLRAVTGFLRDAVDAVSR